MEAAESAVRGDTLEPYPWAVVDNHLLLDELIVSFAYGTCVCVCVCVHRRRKQGAPGAGAPLALSSIQWKLSPTKLYLACYSLGVVFGSSPRAVPPL